MVHMYFDYNDQENQSRERIASCLLKQLLSSLPFNQLPHEIESAFESEISNSRVPALATLAEIFVTSSKYFSAVFVMFDGLDECNPQQLKAVFELIDRFRKSPSIKVFCTARPHLAHEFQKFEGVAVLEIAADRADLENYLSKRLEKEWKLHAGLKRAIAEKLIDRAEGM